MNKLSREILGKRVYRVSQILLIVIILVFCFKKEISKVVDINIINTVSLYSIIICGTVVIVKYIIYYIKNKH